MKKFTKILVACVLILAMVLPFASCSMLFHSNDKLNSIQNEMMTNGYSVDTTGDRNNMSYILGFDIEELPYTPVYMLTAYDTYNYNFVLCVFEFESEEYLHKSFDMLAGAFCDLSNEYGAPLYNISTTDNYFVAGMDSAYSIAMDAIHKSTNSFSGIFEDIFDIGGEIFDFVEEEIIEGIADLIENHNSDEKPSIDLYETKDKLENAGYKVSFQEGNDSVFLFASSSEGFVSFFESNNESIVTQEYQTMVEMWDEIVSEQNENGIYELTYGRNGNVVFYGSTNAVYDALGYYIEPKY